MSFRKWGCLLTAVLLATGCSKGAPEPDLGSEISLKAGNTECFKGMGQRLENFLKGSAEPAEIHAVWSCITQSVQDFDRLTRGARPDGYSAEELRSFLTTYYFKSGLSDKTVKTTMRLKQVLAGGTTDFISRTEISTLLNSISLLDAVTVRLTPSTKVLFSDANSSAPEAVWKQSYQALTSAAGEIAAIFSVGKQSYGISELRDLLNAWADQEDLPANHFLRKIANLTPSLISGKSLLVGGVQGAIGAFEWRPLLTKISRAYSLYRMGVRLNDQNPTDLSLALGSPDFLWSVNGIVGLIDESMLRQPNRRIEVAAVESFLKQLESAGYFPKSVTADDVNRCLRFFVSRVLAVPQSDGSALDTAHMAELHRLMARWQQLDTAMQTSNFRQTPNFDRAIHPGFNLELTSQGQLLLPYAGPATPHPEFPEIYAAVEWIGQKWGGLPMSPDSFHAVIKEWLDFLHTVNLLMDIDDSIYIQLLREANLFIPSSNGDMQLQLSEAFQYGVFALSSYRGSHALKEFAATNHCNADDGNCFRTAWFENRATLLDGFPQLLGWLKGDPNLWQIYGTDVETVGGPASYLKQYMVLHYIEYFMVRWDKNHDELIDEPESLTAFPLFQPILTDMLSGIGLGPGEVKPLYTFLFKYGTTPFGMFGGSVVYLYWKWHPDSWQYQADRKTLASILSELSKM